MLWPLHATGVTGNALRPTYVAYHWATYTSSPLPSHLNRAQMRAAGIPVASDAVRTRRHVSEVLGVVGAGLILGSIASRRRRSPATALALA